MPEFSNIGFTIIILKVFFVFITLFFFIWILSRKKETISQMEWILLVILADDTCRRTALE
jgi:hypothetical protein